jgi:hypothetical protein
MFNNINSALIQPNRFGMMIVITSIVLLSAACGSAAVPPTNPTTAPVVAAPTQVVIPASSSSAKAGACTLLTQDDVSKALSTPVDAGMETGMGGVCTYTSSNLSVSLTVSHTGGIKYMQNTLAKLGDLALVVPGLGDQAFYNTNSIVNSLMLLKGDAVYIISVSDSSGQLTPEEEQAKEKSLAEQMLSHLS